MINARILYFRVPEAGIEPARSYSEPRILSPVCLPIPPLGRPAKRDLRLGWELNPRVKVLQTSALPLGYRAIPHR